MIEFFGADGWPVERFIGRPVTNFIRLCLHTRGLRLTLGTAPPIVTHVLSLNPNEHLVGQATQEARTVIGTAEATAHSAATRRSVQGGLAPDPQTLIARKEATQEAPRGVEEPAKCATIDVDGILHTCELAPGHDGDHVCRAGDWEWQ